MKVFKITFLGESRSKKPQQTEKYYIFSDYSELGEDLPHDEREFGKIIRIDDISENIGEKYPIPMLSRKEQEQITWIDEDGFDRQNDQKLFWVTFFTDSDSPSKVSFPQLLPEASAARKNRGYPPELLRGEIISVVPIKHQVRLRAASEENSWEIFAFFLQYEKSHLLEVSRGRGQWEIKIEGIGNWGRDPCFDQFLLISNSLRDYPPQSLSREVSILQLSSRPADPE